MADLVCIRNQSHNSKVRRVSLAKDNSPDKDNLDSKARRVKRASSLVKGRDKVNHSQEMVKDNQVISTIMVVISHVIVETLTTVKDNSLDRDKALLVMDHVIPVEVALTSLDLVVQ